MNWFITDALLRAITLAAFLFALRPVRLYLGTTGIAALSLACSPFLDAADPNRSCFEQAAVRLAVGVVTGVAVSLCFEILPMIGRVVDVVRGAQYADQQHLDQSERVSLSEDLGQLLAAQIFFFGGGIFFALDLFHGSKVIFDHRLCLESVGAFTRAFTAGFGVVGPVLIAFLLLEAAGAMLSKLLPRLHLEAELGSLRAVIGLLILPAVFQSGIAEVGSLLSSLTGALIQSARGG